MSRHKPTPMQLAASRSRRGASAGKRTPAGIRRTSKGSQARPRWIGRGLIAVVIALAVAVAVLLSAAHGPKPAALAGKPALNGSFTTTSGTTETVSALRGRPTLLWLVATWCSSCQAGTAAMAAQISKFAAYHVRVVELEMADDLGQPGPPIAEFGRQFAGRAYHNPDWTFGTASSSLTREYDPNGYLDIYYLFDAHGRVVDVNGAPAATMGQLLSAAAKVASRA